MDNESQNPIFITGAHRSGTTWLANMLALSGELLIASEPFNLDSWAYKLGGLATHWFTYAPGLNQEKAREAFTKVVTKKTGRVYGRRLIQRYLPLTRRGRVLIKDPIACFSSEWLYQNFSLDVLILVRHPAAFAASLQRMNWFFPFEDLLCQEYLMDDLLVLFREEIEAKPVDIIDQAALLWKLIYAVLFKFAERNTDWIVVTHEELSSRPVAGIQMLYDRLGLTWNANVHREIESYTTSANPIDPRVGVAHQMRRDSEGNIKRWKKVLSSHQVKRIREITGPVAEAVYSNDAW